ncbi:MAG: isochorismatase family protein [Euryarchaeota archaeon]|nr:isochorismatase family protein [Euryarchaeota archaeon]
MPDDNTNTIIEDSVYFHFFELPFDLERIPNFCVEATVRGAVDRDFDCIVLEDCTVSESKEMQEFPMKAIFPMLGVVTTTEELVIGHNT